jgi:ATP-dependent RNA helicase DDX3X
LCRRAFRTGRAPILIATGISARGWDIKDVKHIINYDLPSCMYGGIREYVHRIGRTARIGHQGLATSFYNDRNEDIAQDLVNVLVECDCPVPDFLSHLAPEEGAALQFDDDTDDEAEDGDAAMADNDGGAPVGGAWGTAPAEDGAPAANAWGAAPAENGDAGFTADGGAGASAW